MEEIYVGTFKKYLQMLAPGTVFRLGVENVLQADTGGLIVVGDSPELMNIVSGGFHIDCEFTPSRLYELAKMDGAIITNSDASRIVVANAQLDPDPEIHSDETGIRHRTAERVARQTGQLVVAVSQRRKVVTLYQSNIMFRLRDLPSILVKANQALQTLEKYRNVYARELQRLGGLEFEDMVTVSEVCKVIRRSLKVLNIAGEIENHILELGTEGRLVKMQLDEMIASVEEEALFIIQDYSNTSDKSSQELLNNMRRAFEEDISDSVFIARILSLGTSSSHLEQQVSSRGYRMLHKLPRIPLSIIDNLVGRFGLLSNILRASIEELDDVEGIGEVRARSIKNGLKRMQEQLLLEFML
ncbi:MAG: DNA integrity scanning diadenylate cyclase DisA [Syntrophomonas sp.]|uniref:DNA integrity scanning diadenylate cyclase DisA n=1 Tax=Syntrophomonas sp. TaxID=2053627 RepID=UPI00260985F3|nr:DNA integrity scanning diadenylate cyclase DisA [Syntrophomonas sp.]MDD2509559.1 DNA integrity scanning diadenylate cyclase DisA [Syntrophomonas sp.]MDD3878430.1 DNA integrity scanning diadenylate cyclase DisA [Syntrophomonas sp.]MDD4625471.1 DNA integrity scanning diadenylate cyclase DisA [Syntrophomonas sp.]